MKKELLKGKELSGAGIYGIYSVEGAELLYIGSAQELADRYSSHKHNLENNKYAIVGNKNKRKSIMQDLYEEEGLLFDVLHQSVHTNTEVRNMTLEQQDNLQVALSTLEQFYINLYKPVCNTQKRVTKNKREVTEEETLRRSLKNRGELNPTCKYSVETIETILYLKQLGMKPSAIADALSLINVDIKANYISNIGRTKWLHIEPKIYDDILNKLNIVMEVI